MGVVQNMVSISAPQAFIIIIIIIITSCKGSTFLPVIFAFYFISLIFGKWFYLILAFL